MKTKHRLMWTLCAGLAVMAVGSLGSAIAEVDPATGVESATLAPNAAGKDEPASAESTGIGAAGGEPAEAAVTVESTPADQVQPSGVLRGRGAPLDAPAAPSPEATGVGQ